jgi:hypothetical protein
MLYLGTVAGTPYVAHSLWGYRERKNGREYFNLTNRAVISDLDLGKNSSKGSLRERITQMSVID